MSNFMFNVKQLKMNEFIKYIWQLIIIISTSNATLEFTSLHLCTKWYNLQEDNKSVSERK